MIVKSLHPKQMDFLPVLAEVIPESLAAFLFGLGAASSSIWDQGGLMVEEAGPAEATTWRPTNASARTELLEFFACVCGNRSLERSHEAEPALAAFEQTVRYAFPNASAHLEVECYEPSWCYRLHVWVSQEAGPALTYISLFWSVD
ncbi:hypothetical protein [Roseateles sp. P5_E1]